MVTWVLFLGIGLVLGVVAGLYFGRLDDVSNRQKKELQQKLDDAEQQLGNYKSQVTEHFLKTSALVNDMTDSYRAVHEHLAQGAKSLCDTQVMVQQLDMSQSKLLDDASQSAEATPPQPQSQQETAATPASQSAAEEVSAPEQAAVASETSGEMHPPADAVAAVSEPVEVAEEKAAMEPEQQTTAATEADAHKEEAIAAEPPATPEALHFDEKDTADQATALSDKDAAATPVSRMVH
ncbi:ZapG family protein [Kaarinaea lacus]